ncbi:MAG TPA: hypothetical protein VMZ25_05850, partial [Terriglobales bacterium]|nr:hypothetical protein [Terriglobales bacterium]
AEGVVSAENGLSVESPVEIRFRATPSGKANTQTFSNGDAFTLQANAFAVAAQGGDPFPCSGEEGLRNQLILDAAYRSWKSGRRESVEQL